MSSDTFTWYTVGRYTLDPRFLASEAIEELEQFGNVQEECDEFGHCVSVTLALDETFESSARQEDLEANARWALPISHRCSLPDIVNVTRQSDWLVIDLEPTAGSAAGS